MSDFKDGRRVFLTAWPVYAAFWNPWLQSTMTKSLLDQAVSFVDTNEWALAHYNLYSTDAISLQGRWLTVHPPGLAWLVTPFYLLWRVLVGQAETAETFQVFNGFLVFVLAATSSAFAAVQVAWLARWLGAARPGQLWAAALFAFGTQSFVFGTMLLKEGLCGAAVVTSFRLAIEPGGFSRRTASGAVACVATAFTYQAGLLVPVLLALVGWREGRRPAMGFFLGCAPVLIALGIYNTVLFGLPWRTAYYFATAEAHFGFGMPTVTVLAGLLLGPEKGAGVLLYAPFLVLGLAGLARTGRLGRAGEAAAVGCFVVGLWLVVGAWQSEFHAHPFAGLTIGHRMLYPAIPLLAAFAGPLLEQIPVGWRLVCAMPSFFFSYLNVQAGFIPGGADQLPYALKTWISGTGMGVLFKEALPVWLGLDTLHTVVSRPDVSAEDLLRLLPTPEGFILIRNQLIFLVLNLAVLCCLAWFLRKLWAGSKEGEQRVRQ